MATVIAQCTGCDKDVPMEIDTSEVKVISRFIKEGVTCEACLLLEQDDDCGMDLKPDAKIPAARSTAEQLLTVEAEFKARAKADDQFYEWLKGTMKQGEIGTWWGVSIIESEKPEPTDKTLKFKRYNQESE